MHARIGRIASQRDAASFFGHIFLSSTPNQIDWHKRGARQGRADRNDATVHGVPYRVPSYTDRPERKSGRANKVEMSIPPFNVMTLPTRQSCGPLEWSRQHYERPCLRNLPGSQSARERPQRQLSPMRCHPRNGAQYMAMCVLPKCVRTGRENTGPIPLHVDTVRNLAYNKANALRDARLRSTDATHGIAHVAREELAAASTRATVVWPTSYGSCQQLARIAEASQPRRRREVSLDTVLEDAYHKGTPDALRSRSADSPTKSRVPMPLHPVHRLVLETLAAPAYVTGGSQSARGARSRC